MTCDTVLATLQGALPDLRREFPLRSLALFGSIPRGDHRPDRDIDILVSFNPGARITLFTLSRLALRLTDRLGRDVDLVEGNAGLSAAFRAALNRDLLRVA